MRDDRIRSGASRRLARAGASSALVVAALVGAASAAHAQRQSGIQLTPDSARYLISKDVPQDDPTQRWAITYNLDDKTVTGNVFPLDGGPPQFVWCTTTSVDQAPNPADATYNLSCQFAQPCQAAPCSDAAWNQSPPVDVSVPGSFLLPTGTQSTFGGNVQPIFDETCALPGCHVPGGTGPVDLRSSVAYANIFMRASTEVPEKFYIDPFDPDQSYLYNKVTGEDIVLARMPNGLPPLSEELEQLIETWILEGAANN